MSGQGAVVRGQSRASVNKTTRDDEEATVSYWSIIVNTKNTNNHNERWYYSDIKGKITEDDLPVNGNKAELISKLDKANPSDKWKKSVAPTTDIPEISKDEEEDAGAEEENGGRTATKIDKWQIKYVWQRARFFQMRECFDAELELMRRENELLRLAQPMLVTDAEAIAGQTADMIPKINLSSLKEILPNFDGRKGSYRRWKEHLC